jgi:hypothetical protein
MEVGGDAKKMRCLACEMYEAVSIVGELKVNESVGNCAGE